MSALNEPTYKLLISNDSAGDSSLRLRRAQNDEKVCKFTSCQVSKLKTSSCRFWTPLAIVLYLVTLHLKSGGNKIIGFFNFGDDYWITLSGLKFFITSLPQVAPTAIHGSPPSAERKQIAFRLVFPRRGNL